MNNCSRNAHVFSLNQFLYSNSNGQIKRQILHEREANNLIDLRLTFISNFDRG